MKERLSAIKVNLRMILNRVEELEIELLSYEVIEKIGKIELKVDELSDLINALNQPHPNPHLSNEKEKKNGKYGN